MFAGENISNAIRVFTSCLESFQSSFRSISWKDSCDLGPFLISSTSMTKVSVLSGGILPDNGQHHRKRGQLHLRLSMTWGLRRHASICGKLLVWLVLQKWYSLWIDAPTHCKWEVRVFIKHVVRVKGKIFGLLGTEEIGVIVCAYQDIAQYCSHAPCWEKVD